MQHCNLTKSKVELPQTNNTYCLHYKMLSQTKKYKDTVLKDNIHLEEFLQHTLQVDMYILQMMPHYKMLHLLNHCKYNNQHILFDLYSKTVVLKINNLLDYHQMNRDHYM